MARRLLTTVRMGADSVRIYRDREWDCYVIKVLDRGRTYECEESSLECARDTAAAQIRSLRRMSQAARKFPKCGDVYTRESGREIHVNGQPWVTIHRDAGAPWMADALSHVVVKLLNRHADEVAAYLSSYLGEGK